MGQGGGVRGLLSGPSRLDLLSCPGTVQGAHQPAHFHLRPIHTSRKCRIRPRALSWRLRPLGCSGELRCWRWPAWSGLGVPTWSSPRTARAGLGAGYQPQQQQSRSSRRAEATEQGGDASEAKGHCCTGRAAGAEAGS